MKNIIEISSKYHYLNEIKEYKLNGKDINESFVLPSGIFNKSMPNVGGTTLALEDNNKTIITCPRRQLLINKHAQYKNSLLVMDAIDKVAIHTYLDNTKLPKILVCYDSFYKVIDCINDIDNWHIVVDEFQIILSDASFKSTTEMCLLNNLAKCNYVTYMSATPMLDEFINKIDVLKDIPYYVCKWADTYKVKVFRKKSNNPIIAAVNIVNKYKDASINGNYPYINIDGKKYESKEAVIYLNSVKNIISIIKYTGL